MSMTEVFSKELELEADTTRNMLSRIPDGKYDWQPHPKSMTIKQLSAHIAELPGWITMALVTDELDFSKYTYEPVPVGTTAEVLTLFEQSLASGKASLSQATDEQLSLPWTLRNGEEIYSTSTKGDTIRHAYNQTVHHRAQLGVYLRLLDIPIPGSYGPSADEQDF
ncbi:MAG: DinB family protein [Bacteroidetes bacterium]|nr:DinB family protein [Fibrella sp.]